MYIFRSLLCIAATIHLQFVQKLQSLVVIKPSSYFEGGGDCVWARGYSSANTNQLA